MKYLFIIVTITWVVLSGCDSNSSTLPDEATGTLRGKVGLYDIHGKKLTDASGVRVSIEGTNLITLSDTLGDWSLGEVPQRSVTINFSKEGYDAKKISAFKFVSVDSTCDTVYLFKPLPYAVVIDTISPPMISPIKVGYFAGHVVGAPLEDSTALQVLVAYGTSPAFKLFDTSTYLGLMVFRNVFRHLTKKDSVLTFEVMGWEEYGPYESRSRDWLSSGKKVYIQAFTNYYLGIHADIEGEPNNKSFPNAASPVYMTTIP